MVENEVTDHYQVHRFLAVEDGEHVLGHALPKVNQKVLHLVEVCSHHAVQYPLAMSTVHQQKCLHLGEND